MPQVIENTDYEFCEWCIEPKELHRKAICSLNNAVLAARKTCKVLDLPLFFFEHLDPNPQESSTFRLIYSRRQAKAAIRRLNPYFRHNEWLIDKGVILLIVEPRITLN